MIRPNFDVMQDTYSCSVTNRTWSIFHVSL